MGIDDDGMDYVVIFKRAFGDFIDGFSLNGFRKNDIFFYSFISNDAGFVIFQ